jgi:hypothetical protein
MCSIFYEKIWKFPYLYVTGNFPSYSGFPEEIFFISRLGNVPAETTSPEPERFFGRKRSPVPNLPSPIPNT